MSIKVLPARLANQIAAGEVVERPASVLKELVENSIDSGATQILIEIEKGGHKKIKVSDNGKGIVKDELVLALSRHATSKVSELDDLEHIATLGFRGEALASISSVSRLTLTSRPENQTEAWQARCEGRDMQVIVEPAAHPMGTSVEVLDLFFNTPARRKFLRTEKTEFNHIEELFTRIALSRFDVALKLKHNGKMVKSLPAVANADEHIKRIQQICGNQVCQELVQLESEYSPFKLHGWVSKPGAFRSINDTQFVFVNNRMMRDKLILHAIRQAYEGLLPADKHAFFVLYLSLPLEEVDVNVHPAKHEVRFHQARLVHDFIYTTVCDALNAPFESASATTEPLIESAPVRHNYQPENDYIKPLQAQGNQVAYRGEKASFSSGSRESAAQYTRLMTTDSTADSTPDSAAFAGVQATADTQALAIKPQFLEVSGQGLLFSYDARYYFLSFPSIQAACLKKRYVTDNPASQPLLLPVSVKINSALNTEKLCTSAAQMGMEVQTFANKLILKQVPMGARKQRWQDIFMTLVEQSCCTVDSILACMSQFWELEPDSMQQVMQQIHSEAISLEQITELGAREVPLQDWLLTTNE